MAKVRIGHFVEAQIVQAIGADYIDESEVLTSADEDVRIYFIGFIDLAVHGIHLTYSPFSLVAWLYLAPYHQAQFPHPIRLWCD